MVHISKVFYMPLEQSLFWSATFYKIFWPKKMWNFSSVFI